MLWPRTLAALLLVLMISVGCNDTTTNGNSEAVSVIEDTAKAESDPNRVTARKAIAERRAEMIKKYDEDGDGKLSKSEKKKLVEEMRKRHGGGEGRPQGGRREGGRRGGRGRRPSGN